MRVGIFMPSSPVREPFRSLGLDALRRLGLVPVEPGEVLNVEGYRSRSPQRALAELHALWDDPEIPVLWAGRGGYGSNYLLPLLERLEFPAPKVVIASSDVSYLLWYLLERRRMVVFYGPMVYGALGAGDFDRAQLLAALSANQPPLSFSGRVLCPGQASGLLGGGCLSNFASLLGTSHLPELKGRILLLEDVNERPFRLDRMLWQCEQAGVFRRIRGLLLGEFPKCFKDAGEKAAFYERWRKKLASLRLPVLYDMPFGHSASTRVLPLGVNADIDSENATEPLRCQIGVKW